jgi:hypothetical protein
VFGVQDSGNLTIGTVIVILSEAKNLKPQRGVISIAQGNALGMNGSFFVPSKPQREKKPGIQDAGQIFFAEPRRLLRRVSQINFGPCKMLFPESEKIAS